MQFKGFKPEAMQRIAGTLGYQGDMNGFNDYLNQNPDKMNVMDMYQNKAMQMAKGGMVKRNYADGGGVLEDEQTTISDISAARVTNPVLPTGTTVSPVGTVLALEQLIPTTSGQVTGDIVSPVATADTKAATAPTVTTAATVDPRTVTKVEDVNPDRPVFGGPFEPSNVFPADEQSTTSDIDATLTKTQAAQGEVAPEAVVTGEQQTDSSVSDLNAAQGTAILMDNPVQREIQQGELISGAADAAKAAKFTEEVQAAETTPTEKATVQGQLEGLMQQFEGGETPAWAAGAMRNATAQMAVRGLGASSMAGQAIIQAAMESALPVAMADAQTVASFEAQNLSNRQQRAMLAAQQRATFMGQEFDQAFQARVMNASKISDVANMNFTAEQQVALENSRIANTMALSNLSNEQAVVLAEAAGLSQLDMGNLNNRQQAAVMNAQNIMQMDMTNLSNRQQTETLKAQQRVQALFTDQAAENAARQFNATSQNQTDQFFANLAVQTSQFNAAQTNAQNQYNAGEINTSNRFTSEMMNQREQFNAQNKLVIDQNNAVWRREIATADTVAINRSNELNAAAMLDISESAYNNLWQYYADTMEYAYTAANNERDRMTQLAVAKMQVDANFDIAKWNADSAATASIGNAIVKIATSNVGDTVLNKAWDWATNLL